MPSLDAVRKKFPGAETVAGRVVALHKGAHVDLGGYVGDGMVVLSAEYEELFRDKPRAKKAEEAKPEPKPEGDKQEAEPEEKAKDGIDVSEF